MKQAHANATAAKKAKALTALNAAWTATTRLRSTHDDKWHKDMRKFVKAAATKEEAPFQTVLDQFQARLSGGSAAPVGRKTVLVVAEEIYLYNWLEHMRQEYDTPTELELRQQVFASFCCMLSSMLL